LLYIKASAVSLATICGRTGAPPCLATGRRAKWRLVMFKIAVLVWVILGVVVAGVAVIAILNIPGFAGKELQYIPIAAIVGYVIAIPFSIAVAKAITKNIAA
jgi:hypothetical protein